jgi:hypothetical protein
MTIEIPSALYFPATRLSAEAAGPLLLVADKLFAYRPAEGPPAIPQPLAAAGLVEPYPPVELGAQLDHFRRLLKDMQTHSAEYYQAYLSSLATGAEEDPEVGWRQVARRLRQTHPASETKENAIWRARLYLALAEQQASLQEELATGIEAVARREAELLRQLQGEDEEVAELPLFSTALAAAAPVQKKQLLAAWGMLYLADRNPDRPWLLATAQEESAAMLFEEYETATGRTPEKLLTLMMPPLAIEPEEEFLEQRRSLRAAGHDLLVRLGEFLTQAAGGETGPGDAGSGTATELATAWQQLMAPAPARVLTFYRLAGISFPRLFGLFCRQDDQPGGPSTPHAVLAVLDAGKR